MTDMLRGGCLCGDVRYRITATPQTGLEVASLPGSYCHCSMCRKATGGGYAAYVSIPRAALSWVRGAPTWFRSSPIASRGFCAICGSPLFYDADAQPTLDVTVGSLDDPSMFRPALHYGVEARLAWADCGPDLPGQETTERFEGQP